MAATAAFGLAEVAIYRLVTPILVHALPEGRLEWSKGAVAGAGSLAFRATAALAVVALLVWMAEQPRQRWPGAALVGAAVAATLVTAVGAVPLAVLAGHVLFLAAGAALLVSALAVRRNQDAALLAVAAVAAVALAVARVPLLVDAWGRWVGDAARAPAELMTVAEAAFLAVPIVAAAAVFGYGRVPRSAWWAAGITAALIGAAVARAPAYVAISAMWATGLTLSLPVPAYVVAGAAAAIVAVSALRRPDLRPLLLGLALLLVAGAQPSVVHHNATALLALAVLSTAGSPRRAQQAAARSHLSAEPATA